MQCESKGMFTGSLIDNLSGVVDARRAVALARRAGIAQADASSVGCRQLYSPLAYHPPLRSLLCNCVLRTMACQQGRPNLVHVPKLTDHTSQSFSHARHCASECNPCLAFLDGRFQSSRC